MGPRLHGTELDVSQTAWGVVDGITRLDTFGVGPDLPLIKQYPLLFDTQHQPKPCVYQMIDAVK